MRPGVNGVVNNWGRIVSVTTTGSSSDGVDVQANSGVVVNNNAGGVIEGGRHGITGGAPDVYRLDAAAHDLGDEGRGVGHERDQQRKIFRRQRQPAEIGRAHV